MAQVWALSRLGESDLFWIARSGVGGQGLADYNYVESNHKQRYNRGMIYAYICEITTHPATIVILFS